MLGLIYPVLALLHESQFYGLLFVLSQMIIIILVLFILYLITLKNALRKCSPENRKLMPGLVWLLSIPIFNFFWHFVVVITLTMSLSRELKARGIKNHVRLYSITGILEPVLVICQIFLMEMSPSSYDYLNEIIEVDQLLFVFLILTMIFFIAFWSITFYYSSKLDAEMPVE